MRAARLLRYLSAAVFPQRGTLPSAGLEGVKHLKKYTLLGATVLVSLAGGNSPEIYANSVAATARADSPADTPQPDDGNRTNTAATPDTGPTQAGAREPGLAEIIVTAQKRAQRINDVGMSITAVPAQELVEKGITDISGLTRVEPSLQYSISNNGTPIFSIRGVGYFEQSLSATPAVSAYQDEVPYLYPIMAKERCWTWTTLKSSRDPKVRSTARMRPAAPSA